MSQGWMGRQRELLDALAAIGADQDKDGRYLVHNGGVYSFMGVDDPDNEVLVDETSTYLVDGVHHGLSKMLNERGIGLCNVSVIL